MITLKKVNDEKVRCIPIKKKDSRKTKGSNLFEEIYANIFLLARKKSGKTTVLWNIIRKCIDRNTRVFIFSSTIEKDQNMKVIVKDLLKKKNMVETFTSILDDGGNNQLQNILNELVVESDIEEEESESEPEPRLIAVDGATKKRPIRRKKKYIAPEVLFVFDDLSTELRNPVINNLLKTNRHYKSKVLLSSQYLHDLQPQAIRQLDYLLAFKGLTPEKIQKVVVGLDLMVGLPMFQKLYHDATETKFNFLYIDVAQQIFRKNFNCQYELSPFNI